MADIEVVKVILVGDETVGKSAILKRFTNDTFVNEYITTIGVDFGIQSVETTIGKKHRKLQIWDTAGQERFRTITASYYRGAHLVFIIYDITNRASYESAKAVWLREVEKYASEKVIVALVGNKIDLAHLRTITTEESAEWALAQKIQFCEVSTKSELNEGGIDKLFQWAVDVMITNDLKLTPSPIEESLEWLKKIGPFWDSIAPVLSVKNGLSFYEPLIKFSAPNLAKEQVQQWIAMNSATLTSDVLTKMTHFVHLNTYERKHVTVAQAVHLFLLGRAVNSPKLSETAVNDLMLLKADDSDIMSAPKLIGDASVIDLNESMTVLSNTLLQKREAESVKSNTVDPRGAKFGKQWSDLIANLYGDRDLTGDMAVVVEGKPFKAHKLVLIYNSDFFARCMLGNFREADKAEIVLDGEVTIAAWECLQKYFYTGQMLHIESPDDCLAVISCAPYLMLTSEAKFSVSHANLLYHCDSTAYDSITEETALELLLSAHKNEDKVAKDVAMKYITNNYFKLIEKYEAEFIKLPKPLMFAVMNRLIVQAKK